jgi:RNA polymerase sigma factor (sigma-70 family)
MARDAAARARAVEEAMPLLRRWAARYRGEGVEMEDLVQEAVVGLLRAFERYDPERGVPFPAWARWWVRQALQQAVAESTRPVRLPTHVLWDMHELKDARERLTRERGREPRAMELADELGWTADHLADVLRAERPAEAIESPDLVEYPLSGEAYEEVIMRVAAEQIRPTLLQLTERERAVLAARGAGESLRTIGRRLGISGERVRTIEGRALAKLRASAASGG